MMRITSPALIFLALVAAPATAADTGRVPSSPRFQGLFVDWSAANKQSIDAERDAARRPAVDAAPASSGGPGSASLGERVGEIVATGDCAEGERIARAAGDFALVAAVRQHCTAANR